MQQLLGSEWDRAELAQTGKTPDGEFRVYNMFVPAADGEPQAYLVRSYSDGATVGLHFHEHPQFQVFVEGAGIFQRHAVGPIAVHFTDAYSVYGPIIAGDPGLSFFVLRAELDAGGQYMPGSREKLIRRGKRNLSEEIDLERLDAEGRVTVFADDDGLLGEAVRLRAGESTALPDASGVPACYTLVLEGSATSSETALDKYSVIHRRDGDGPLDLIGGVDGCMLLHMRFPAVEAT
ncbi:MAG TPA: hypothetical protein VGM78_03425, partial [Ilumatobacteraceae bacterium]